MSMTGSRWAYTLSNMECLVLRVLGINLVWYEYDRESLGLYIIKYGMPCFKGSRY